MAWNCPANDNMCVCKMKKKQKKTRESERVKVNVCVHEEWKKLEAVHIYIRMVVLWLLQKRKEK